MKPKYPEIKVRLSGRDGNSRSIIVTVEKALKQAGVGITEMDEFAREAMSGDYDHLLQTCMKWVDVS